MNAFEVKLPVIYPDEPPQVDMHYEWRQYALWLSGLYGFRNIDGHEIGLSPELVQDLIAWVVAEDEYFNQDDPLNSGASEDYLERGFLLALRVRQELPDEWIVTGVEPKSRAKIVISRFIADNYTLD